MGLTMEGTENAEPPRTKHDTAMAAENLATETLSIAVRRSRSVSGSADSGTEEGHRGESYKTGTWQSAHGPARQPGPATPFAWCEPATAPHKFRFGGTCRSSTPRASSFRSHQKSRALPYLI